MNRNPQSNVWILAIGLLLGLFFVIIWKAYLLEDAFIVLRSIKNFHEGYYFSAIPDVRSQSYTSNIWTLILLFGTFFSSNYPIVVISLSLLFASASFLLMFYYGVRENAPIAVIVSLTVLLLSNAFTDYSTSGLENPLSYFLVGLFVIALLNVNSSLFTITVVYAFIVANRYDQSLLCLPLYSFYVLDKILKCNTQYTKIFIQIFFGFAPLITWLSFSWFYYGSIFPDTYFAKIHTGVPVADRIHFAILHQIRMLDTDFVGMIIWMGLVINLMKNFKSKWNKRSQSIPVYNPRGIADLLVLGTILYGAYFLYIGGDYMIGRFFSIIFYVNAWVILIYASNSNQFFLIKSIVVLILIYTLKNFFSPHFFVPGQSSNSPLGLVRVWTFDQRKFPQNWYLLGMAHKKKDWQETGIRRGLTYESTGQNFVIEDISAGIIPYYGGIHYRLIDRLGLSDPLLSRLPCHILHAAAHCERIVPAGYKDFIKSGSLDLMDSDLSIYTKALFDIKTLPLFDYDRVKILLEFTFGRYDVYKSVYIQKYDNDFYTAGNTDVVSIINAGYAQTIFAPFFTGVNASSNLLGW